MLASGSSFTEANECKMRGKIHLLLVGDGGSFKVPLLTYAAALAPFTSSCTAVYSSTNKMGLTLAVQQVHSDSHWYLEAGTLSLAHKGIFFVPNLSFLKKNELAMLREAVCLAVSKENITTSVPCECSVVANIAFCSDSITSKRSEANYQEVCHVQYDLTFFLLRSSLLYQTENVWNT